MKTKFLTLILILSTFLTTQAQDLKFGVKAGANFSSLFGDSTDDIDGQTDFHVGGLVNIQLISWLALQPEEVYSRQGYQYDSFAGFGENTGNLDYLNVPVLVDFTVVKGLSLHGGPQFGFNLVSEEDSNAGTTDVDARSVLIGNAIGIQYQLPNLGLFFQARYASDFVTAFNEDDIEAFNSTYSLSVGWFFD